MITCGRGGLGLKIWKKFVLFTIVIISIVLSFSRYFIVKNNFVQSIENTSKQNVNQHIMEKYMLESNIVKNIQMGEEVSDEKIIEYLNSVYTYMDNDSEFVALYTEDYNQIYSNISNIDSLDISTILNEYTNTYCLREINGTHYMLFSSYLNINDKIIYIINAYNVDSIYEERDRQMSAILVMDIITLGVSMVAIFIISIYITKPISSLNKASKQIASGKFYESVKIRSGDEIGELAQSFNVMAEQIENKIDELNLQIRRKNDFINGFTHELKTPMTAMMGYADLLRFKKCDEEISKKALNYIYTETKRLESLSYKLMQLMHLTDDRIDFVNVDVVNFFYKAIKIDSNVRPDITIELDIEPSVVKGDYELLEVVIRNLVENAKKSEPRDNKVFIKGRRSGTNKYRVSIIDSGKGIPKEHINKVTEDFYMVDKSRSRSNGGSGIGLSLVKKILVLHNSDICIKSMEGVGTTVYFDLEVGSDEI